MKEFGDVGAFASHLVSVSAAIERSTRSGLERAAKLIENDAKKQIGKYQDAVGPFQDWAPLSESTEAEKERLGYRTGAPLLRDGDLRDSITHEVEGDAAVVGSKLDVAAYQEFGTEAIPPRPFIGPAAFKNKEKIEQILGESVVRGLIGGDPIHPSLGYDFDT